VGKMVYREYQPDDAEMLCRLHSSVFGVSRTPAFWHWKYSANPAGVALVYVAEDTETRRIVGHSADIPVRMGLNGELVPALQAMDILVEEKYRSRLVHLELLARMCQRVITSPVPFAFAFAFGEAVTLRISSRLVGARAVAPIPRTVRLLSFAPYAPRLLRRTAEVADTAYRLFTRLRAASVPSGAAVQRVHSFDSRYDRFWSQQASRLPLAVWRDSAYLNWRYMEPPGGNYEAYALERQGEILGFSVLRLTTTGGRVRGRILELVAIEDDKAIAAPLLAHALGRFYEQRAAAVASWIFSEDPLWRVMRRSGFLSRRQKGRMLLVIPTPDSQLVADDFIADPSNWRISMGDSDEI